jgi:hypothetical protein
MDRAGKKDNLTALCIESIRKADGQVVRSLIEDD